MTHIETYFPSVSALQRSSSTGEDGFVVLSGKELPSPSELAFQERRKQQEKTEQVYNFARKYLVPLGPTVALKVWGPQAAVCVYLASSAANEAYRRCPFIFASSITG